MKKVAVYSGSFDPIHIGHTMVASYIAQFAGVDEVWMLVSPLNPLKAAASPPASPLQRLDMARLAIGDAERIRVSDFELSMPLPTYSYRTLCALSERFPDCSFSLVVGSDNILLFDRWRNYREILSRFGVIVYPRPGYPADPDKLPEGATLLPDAPTADISSTFIREAIASGFDMRFFIPAAAAEYIAANDLYRN